MPAKPCGPAPLADPAASLNESARLYPWTAFDQTQLQLMTGYSREVISAAFGDDKFPHQFGKSRPEQVFEWVQKQEAGIQVKEVKK